jgi:hypothetical protein
MSQSNADEIDLGIIFTSLKNSFNNLLIRLYYAIQFLIKKWWVIGIILILGIASGYLYEKNIKPEKTTTIIIQTNFKSTSYVYSALNLLNYKLDDNSYLEQIGFNHEGLITEIEIEPIVNILELLEKTMFNYRAIEPLLEKADFEDELLTSEVFFTDYKYHKIFLSTTSDANDEVIQNLINYLNSNSKFNEIKAVVIEDTKDQIIELNKTIEGINNVMNSISEKSSVNSRPEDIYISTGSGITDMGLLMEKKSGALKLREIMRTEIVKYDKIVTVMNNPSLHPKDKLFPIGQETMPFYFLVVFLMYSYLKYQYKKVKKLVENKNSEL